LIVDEQRLRSAFRSRPGLGAESDLPRASVAAIFRAGQSQAELLFIE
jgi:hypothetical protein